jgi:hypothetical protein
MKSLAIESPARMRTKALVSLGIFKTFLHVHEAHAQQQVLMLVVLQATPR